MLRITDTTYTERQVTTTKVKVFKFVLKQELIIDIQQTVKFQFPKANKETD